MITQIVLPALGFCCVLFLFVATIHDLLRNGSGR